MIITTKHKLGSEKILAITLAAFAGAFLAIYYNNYPPKFNVFSSIPTIQEEPVTTPMASPLPKPQTTSQISSDGTKKLIMQKTYNGDKTQTYTFSTANGSDTNEQTVFSKTLDDTNSMSIPFNAWSPDNKYFFVQQQTKDGNVTNVLVFKESGESLSSEEKYLNVTDLFSKRNTGNNFAEATGWASETLIIINTTKADNTKGPSYWFELPSKAIIQLSTDF